MLHGYFFHPVYASPVIMDDNVLGQDTAQNGHRRLQTQALLDARLQVFHAHQLILVQRFADRLDLVVQLMLCPRVPGQVVQQERNRVNGGVDTDQQHVKNDGQYVLRHDALLQQQALHQRQLGGSGRGCLHRAQVLLRPLDVFVDDAIDCVTTTDQSFPCGGFHKLPQVQTCFPNNPTENIRKLIDRFLKRVIYCKCSEAF